MVNDPAQPSQGEQELRERLDAVFDNQPGHALLLNRLEKVCREYAEQQAREARQDERDRIRQQIERVEAEGIGDHDDLNDFWRGWSAHRRTVLALLAAPPEHTEADSTGP